MTAWRVEMSKRAVKQLGKIGKPASSIIVAWLKKNVDGCENPRAHGKALVGDRAGFWRYRVGDYRVICELRDSELVVLAVEVGHRREIYGN